MSKFTPFSISEMDTIQKIMEDYINWGVTVPNAYSMGNEAIPEDARKFGIIIMENFVLAPINKRCAFIMPPQLNIETTKQTIIEKVKRDFGDDVCLKNGLMRVELDSKMDAGPWLEVIRQWMVDTRNMMNEQRIEQIKILSENLSK